MYRFTPGEDDGVKSSKALSYRHRLLRPIETEYDTNWRTAKFWRNAFLIYWFFALVGHILEILWVSRPMLFGLPPTNVLPLFVVAAPYGFGALALIWLVYPLVRENKSNAWGIFGLSCLLGGAIELLCGLAIMAWSPDHINHYWDYSDRPFNLWGQICLGNCLAFGVAAVPGVYWAFPIFNNVLNYLDKKYSQLISAFTIGLFTVYVVIQVMVISGNPPAKVFNLPRPYADPAGLCKGRKSCPPPGYPRRSFWPDDDN